MNSNHSQRKHSKFSASASKRWMTCPGSVALSEHAPPQAESPWAKEGTDAHECLEFLVKRFSNIDRAKGEALARWPLDMVEYCVRSAHVIFGLRPSPSAKLFTEQRVYLKSLGKGFFGTLDYAWAEDWGKLVVIDFKYGVGVSVGATDDNGEPNSQLMYYALGLIGKLGDDFETVSLVVLQPRVYDFEQLPVSETTVSIREVKAFEKKLRLAIEKAKAPAAALSSGDHCRFCPATSICPEVSTVAMAKADIVFDVAQGEVIGVPAPRALTPETLPNVLTACALLEEWIKAVRAHAFELANAGTIIPGFKLVAKRASRIWTETGEKEAFNLFGTGVYSEVLLSPSQLEKKFGAKAKEFTAQHTVAVSSGFNLVPEKHKSPAIQTNSVFDH